MPTRKARVFALRHLGLDADKDVQLLALGTNEVMWSALQTGQSLGDKSGYIDKLYGGQVK